RERAEGWGKFPGARAGRVMTQGKSPVREFCTPGSVRGAPGNGRPYRDTRHRGARWQRKCPRGGPQNAEPLARRGPTSSQRGTS
ncbi:MAG: hypothetical protein EXR72_14310, partial [Myxococcales bacterium]|nr:hypothetical protein [Myxococcales bacterium]